MKTFRFLGMALMAILIGVNFIACSDDEDDANFEGTWYLASEKWYSYNADGTPNMGDLTYAEEYPYHKGEIWTITKKSNGSYTLQRGIDGNIVEFGLIKKNTYKKLNDLFIIKTLTAEKMVIEYIDHYFEFFDASGKLINTDSEEIMENLEFGYYTLTK